MVATASILDTLRTIDDPEMPISIVDLGIVGDVHVDDDGATVTIVILPTFVGCPALDMIRDDIERAVGAMTGVDAVVVRFAFDPPWTVDRISEDGRESLRLHGVTVPGSGAGAGRGQKTATVTLRTSAIPCPYCGSTETRLESPFGPTRCRAIHYCDACRNVFEHMKRVAPAE